MLLLALAAEAADGCPDRADTLVPVNLERAIDEYAAGNLPVFEALARETHAALPCLAAPIDRLTAARLHLVEALGMRLLGEDAGPFLVSAARAGLTDAMVPEELRTGSLAIPLPVTDDTPASDPLPLPWRGVLLVDGRRSSTRPVGQAFTLQRVTLRDRVLETSYLVPDARPFKYIRLGTVAAATSLTGAAVLTGAAIRQSQLQTLLHDTDWEGDAESLHRLQDEHNALYIVELVGLSGLSLGLGVLTGTVLF